MSKTTVLLAEQQWRATNGALDNAGIVASQNGDDELASRCLALRQAGEAWIKAHGFPVRLELTDEQHEMLVNVLDDSLAAATLLGDVESVDLLRSARAEFVDRP